MTAPGSTPLSRTSRGSTSRGTAPLRRAERALEIPVGRLLAAVGSAAATLGAAFALAAMSAYLVTRAWTMPPVLDLTVAVVMVRGLGVARGVFRWIDRMLTHDVALRGVVSLRTNLFTALASRGDDALFRLRRGDLLARIGDDAQELAQHVISAIVPALVSLVMLVVVIATFAPLSGIATAVMAASLLLASVLAPLAAHRAARISEDAVVTSRSQVTARALEILDDATGLRIDGRLEGALEAMRTEQAEHDAAIDRAALPSAIASAAVPLTMILAVTGSLLGAGAAWLDGGASAGQVGILLLLPLSSFEAATALPAAASQYARSQAAARRLDEVAGDPTAGITGAGTGTDTDAGSTAVSSQGATSPAAVERPATAVLSAQGLTAGWSPQAPRVAGLDLDLAPGSRIVVAGASGTGKSTLLATLAGLLDPLGGAVRLDGEDVAGMDPAQVRARVTYFAEDAHVFATTLRENLRVVRGGITDQEAQAALEAVGLDDWVRGLPAGLGTMLGPDGTTISGGERRRLLLARAVLRAGPVLLLDEPTEHLDTERGDALLRSLLDPQDTSLLPASTTAVVVTHRLEAIPSGTAVLHIHDGAAITWTEAP